MEITRSILALVATLALMLGCVAIINTYGHRLKGILRKPNHKRRLTCVETVMLTSRHAAHLLQADENYYLVMTSPEGTTVTPHTPKTTAKKSPT